jgi:hypothetical protein
MKASGNAALAPFEAEQSLWEQSLWEQSLWEQSLWEQSLWERRPRRDTHSATRPSRHDRGGDAAPTGVSASTEHRPQSRPAMQGRQWIAAPTGAAAGRIRTDSP